MNFTLFAAVLSATMLMGCSHVQDTKRFPASVTTVKDVGVIGPDGSVILFYKEGDYIIVKNCDPNTILGLTPVQARANCEGKFNKVPVESFKQALRNLVSTDRLNILKPLTPEEVQAYSKDGPSSEQMEAMITELDKINSFIVSYGAENANLVRKEELVKALRSNETRVSAIKKINTEIERALSLITDQTKLTLTKFNTDKDQFLYTVLKNFNPAAKFPCGLKGPVEERIRDCSYQESSVKGGFTLVTRTKEFKEVHKDTKSGLLWGDRLPSNMNQYNAEKACKDMGKLDGLSWRLPTKEEYETANTNGIRSALPNMNYWFWSSSVHASYSDIAYLFYGGNGNVFNVNRNYSDVSVRCVAR